MKLEKIKSPNIKNDIKMNCDTVIDKKLMEYPMINCCFSHSNYTVLCGKMGSGKTSLLLKVLSNIYNRCFENIYIIMPPISRKSIDKNFIEKQIPEDCIYDDLTAGILEEIYLKILDNSENKENSLVIIDDMQQHLKEKDVSQSLEKFIIKIRHLHTSIFLLCQNFKKIPKNSRQLITNLIFYDMGKSQNSQIFDEVMPISKTEFLDLMKVGFSDPHEFLCLNLKHNRIFNNFDFEIII
jgi:thymidine kinase